MSARFIKENELNESAAARLRGATKEVGLKWRWEVVGATPPVCLFQGNLRGNAAFPPQK